MTIGTTVFGGCLADNQGVEGGHLFVENELNEERVILLSVANANTDEQIAGGRYRLPGQHAAQFSEVLESGTTYDIRVYQPSVEEPANIVTNITTCEEGDPSDRMDVVVTASGIGPTVLTKGCDSDYTQREELTYDPPSEFRVGNITGTVPGN